MAKSIFTRVYTRRRVLYRCRWTRALATPSARGSFQGNDEIRRGIALYANRFHFTEKSAATQQGGSAIYSSRRARACFAFAPPNTPARFYARYHQIDARTRPFDEDGIKPLSLVSTRTRPFLTDHHRARPDLAARKKLSPAIDATRDTRASISRWLVQTCTAPRTQLVTRHTNLSVHPISRLYFSV